MTDTRLLLSGVAEEVAPRLLGWKLSTRIEGEITEVVLTEVEAYGPDDPASHAFRGITQRNRVMFGPAGHLYVYRSYGMHWCANIVTGLKGRGSAILLRAGAPIRGLETMIARRGRIDHLTDGPGKLCSALGIEGIHSGLDLLARRSPIRLVPSDLNTPHRVTTRIGISRAIDYPWRFVAEREPRKSDR